jgi:hypothetical protein
VGAQVLLERMRERGWEWGLSFGVRLRGGPHEPAAHFGHGPLDEDATAQQVHRVSLDCDRFPVSKAEEPEYPGEQRVRLVEVGNDRVDDFGLEVRGFAARRSRQSRPSGDVASDDSVAYRGVEHEPEHDPAFADPADGQTFGGEVVDEVLDVGGPQVSEPEPSQSGNHARANERFVARQR